MSQNGFCVKKKLFFLIKQAVFLDPLRIDVLQQAIEN